MNLKGELGVPLARLVQLVTEVVLANNTAKNIDTTVPAGKRWRLLNIKVANPDDVARNINILKYLEAAKTHLISTYVHIEEIGVAASLNVPSKNHTDERERELITPDIYDAGNTINVIWAAGGASAGGTDADGLVIEYLEIDYP